MDFNWTKEQLDYRDSVVEFARQELVHAVAQGDRDCVFPRDNWNRCADFGIQGLSLPAKFNGKGDVDFVTAILAMEALVTAVKTTD